MNPDKIKKTLTPKTPLWSNVATGRGAPALSMADAPKCIMNTYAAAKKRMPVSAGTSFFVWISAKQSPFN